MTEILDRPIGDVIYLPEHGIIDAHGHGRDSDQAHKTTYEQYLFEAQRSFIGVTSFQPNPQPPIDNIKMLIHNIDLAEKARKKNGMPKKQRFFFGANDRNFEEARIAFRDYGEYMVGTKAYFLRDDGSSVTTGKVGIRNYESLEKHGCVVREFNRVLDIHPDDPWIIREDNDYTIRSESVCVSRSIMHTEKIDGLKMTMCHVSCADSVRPIMQAWRRGRIVALELCPHYLIFNCHGYNWNPDLDPAYYWCYTPLRDEFHQLYLITAFAFPHPLIYLASDSACHEAKEKLIRDAEGYPMGGFPGHQELLPVAITKAKEMRLTNRHLLNLVYYNPGNHLGIPTDDKLVPYRIEEWVDDCVYNKGKVVNPYKGLKFWVPVERIG